MKRWHPSVDTFTYVLHLDFHEVDAFDLYGCFPSAVELVRQMESDLITAMEGPADMRSLVLASLGESWSEPVVSGLVAAALEKSMSKKDIEKALKVLTPEVQAIMRDGAVPSDPNVKPHDLLWEAVKLPDAPARQAAIERIVPFLPEGAAFRGLATELVDMMADVAAMTTGSDTKRGELQKTYWKALEPTIAAMNRPDGLVEGGLIAYRKRSLADLRMLADALNTPEGTKLQKAAAAAVLTGAREARNRAIVRLHADISKAAKKKVAEKN